MHIAICDDNIADRKQLERLLSRESDQRKHTSGALYVDSYGNADALTKSPMIYDLFFIDMVQAPPHGMEICTTLREMGVTAMIVLCCSQIDYRAFASIPENVRFLDKPILKEELSTTISTALVKKMQAVPTIEIRGEDTTHYILENDFIYAYPDGHNVKVVLTSGKVITQLGGMKELIIAVNGFSSFILLGKDYLVNINHIKQIEKRTAILSDMTKIPLKLNDKQRIKHFA